MSDFKAALALLTNLHEIGRLSYGEYLELHKAMTARHTAEHMVTIDFTDGEQAWKMTCTAPEGAECRVDEDGENLGDACDAVEQFNSGLTNYGPSGVALGPGRIEVPVYPYWDGGGWELALAVVEDDEDDDEAEPDWDDAPGRTLYAGGA